MINAGSLSECPGPTHPGRSSDRGGIGGASGAPLKPDQLRDREQQGQAEPTFAGGVVGVVIAGVVVFVLLV